MKEAKKYDSSAKNQLNQLIKLIVWMSIAEAVCIFLLIPLVHDSRFLRIFFSGIPVLWLWTVYIWGEGTKLYFKVLLWCVMFAMIVWHVSSSLPLEDTLSGNLTHVCALLLCFPAGLGLARMKLFPSLDYLMFFDIDKTN